MSARTPRATPIPIPAFAPVDNPELSGSGVAEEEAEAEAEAGRLVAEVAAVVLVVEEEEMMVVALARPVRTPSSLRKKPVLSAQQVGSLSQQ